MRSRFQGVQKKDLGGFFTSLKRLRYWGAEWWGVGRVWSHTHTFITASVLHFLPALITSCPLFLYLDVGVVSELSGYFGLWRMQFSLWELLIYEIYFFSKYRTTPICLSVSLSLFFFCTRFNPSFLNWRISILPEALAWYFVPILSALCHF